VPWTDDLNKKFKEKYDQRRSYADRLMVFASGAEDNAGVHVLISRVLSIRLSGAAARLGWSKRKLAGALIGMALDELDAHALSVVDVNRDLESGPR